MYSVTTTAKSWDSYRVTLIKVLKAFNPYSVLEYGPGESTRIMQDHNSIVSIDSIEHNEAWAARLRDKLNSKVFLQIEPNEFKYPFTSGRIDKYDIVFIDGVKRIECLMVSKFRMPKEGIIIIHDAERPEYQSAMSTFEYKFFTDDGHTCVLTNDYKTSIKLSETLW
jgi:hypothetical protein